MPPLRWKTSSKPSERDIGRRLLAAYAAGAEHGDLACPPARRGGARPRRESRESSTWRDRWRRRRCRADLVVVAGVDDDRLGVGDQRVPVAGIDIGAGSVERVDISHAHGDDLLLEPHLHAVERHGVGFAVFDVEPGELGHRVEMRDEFGDRRRTAGDGAVDAFAGDQQRALDAATAAEGGERRAQLLVAVEPRETVERRDAKGRRG